MSASVSNAGSVKITGLVYMLVGWGGGRGRAKYSKVMVTKGLCRVAEGAC